MDVVKLADGRTPVEIGPVPLGWIVGRPQIRAHAEISLSSISGPSSSFWSMKKLGYCAAHWSQAGRAWDTLWFWHTQLRYCWASSSNWLSHDASTSMTGWHIERHSGGTSLLSRPRLCPRTAQMAVAAKASRMFVLCIIASMCSTDGRGALP